MKNYALSLVILILLVSCNAEVSESQTTSKEVIDEVKEAPSNPAVRIVDQQLKAYNASDIDAFIATYADSVEIYNTKGHLQMKGHAQLRNGYADFFANTPLLRCEILNRITINSTAIDSEEVTLHDSTTIFGVAIYKVANGKIQSVSFID
jgi:hypothetical protein